MKPWKRLVTTKSFLEDTVITGPVYLPVYLVDHCRAIRRDGLDYRVEDGQPVMLYDGEDGDDALVAFYELDEADITLLFGTPTLPTSRRHVIKELVDYY